MHLDNLKASTDRSRFLPAPRKSIDDPLQKAVFKAPPSNVWDTTVRIGSNGAEPSTSGWAGQCRLVSGERR